MRIGRKVPWIVVASALVLLLVPATTWGGDEETPPPEPETRTSHAVVVIRTTNGETTRTVRVVESEDGKWRLAEDDGETVVVEWDEEVESDAQAAAPRRSRAPRRRRARGPRHDPMHTVLRWLVKKHTGKDLEVDTIAEWFEGDDVPLQDLRDLFVEDGWDAASLERWMRRGQRAQRGRRAQRARRAQRGPRARRGPRPRRGPRGRRARLGDVRASERALEADALDDLLRAIPWIVLEADEVDVEEMEEAVESTTRDLLERLMPSVLIEEEDDGARDCDRDCEKCEKRCR